MDTQKIKTGIAYLFAVMHAFMEIASNLKYAFVIRPHPIVLLVGQALHATDLRVKMPIDGAKTA